MLVNGNWVMCDDAFIRPLISASVMALDQTWSPAEFLVDTGADRTVFCGAFLRKTGLTHRPAPHQLGGVGGSSATVVINTEIRLTLTDGNFLTLEGAFAAFANESAIDMNILGRDILDLFAVIVDKPGGVVNMLTQGHRYAVTKSN
jgi:aspartyl protease